MRNLYGFRNWNEYNLNPLTRNNWRASLVPAAAVIPAPIAYIKVVAVKKLVVEFQAPFCFRPLCLLWPVFAFGNGGFILVWGLPLLVLPARGTRPNTFTLKKLECSKQAF